MVPPLELIPEHSVLSESEAKKVANKYGIPMKKFPKILITDPQVKRLNAKPGDLIAINRNDPSGKYMYYRIVEKD